MKLAFLSHILPPSWTGQAMVIGKLLRGLSPDDYCLLSVQEYPEDAAGYTRRLPARYYHLRPSWQIRRGYRRGTAAVRQCLNGLCAPLAVRARAGQIARVVRREGCEAIVACSGDLLDVPAGYLAARMTGAAFYAYLFDDYAGHFTLPPARAFARRVEAECLRGAAGVIVPNAALAEVLSARHGIAPTVIHNPCELDAYAPEPPRREDGEDIRLVYTGTLYEAHFDAFRNLLAALRLLPHLPIRVHLYTITPARVLQAAGLRGPLVLHPHAPDERIPAIQQGADILFLPLAFASAYPALIATSAPGKMGEYLAAGRPVLVHAPADAFVCRYFRAHDCGAVVDVPDAAQLAAAIRALVDDPARGEAMARRARARAEADFDVVTARRQFAALLGLTPVEGSAMP